MPDKEHYPHRPAFDLAPAFAPCPQCGQLTLGRVWADDGWRMAEALLTPALGEVHVCGSLFPSV